MAIIPVSVAVTATRANLGSLVAAALGQTVQTLGNSFPAAAPRVSQLVIQNDPSSAGAVYVGGSGVTATANKGFTIPAGSSQTLGDGEIAIGDLSQLFVVAATTATLSLALVD